jgi:hypothetical protein
MRKFKGHFKAQYAQQEVTNKVVPAPTDGWNSITPLAIMDPKLAPILDNWVPRPGWLEVRGGSVPWVDITGGPIETLITYRALGVETFFAAGNGKIYDISGLGNGATAVQTALANNRWNWINFTPLLGTTVIQLANGFDTLRQWNGTVWSAPAITGLPYAGGNDTRIIRNIWTTKRRIWYVLNDATGKPTTVGAFMPTDAIAGPIDGTQDLGGLWTKGGYLVAITDLTLDGGNGPNDYTAFISSQGQVTLFSGDDPATAGNWQLAGGTFNMSRPIGDRCAYPIGADVAIITMSGLVPLAQTLPFDPSADRSVAITSRIQNAMSEAALLYSNNFGWQTTTYAEQDLLILNIPIVEGAQQMQFVMNTLTGAWCRFIGWDANCFGRYQNNLYFGGNDGQVFLAYVGLNDTGEPIFADVQCAYNYFDEPGRLKRMTMIQPLMNVETAGAMIISIDADFAISDQTTTSNFLVGSLWDVDLWDGAVWAIDASTFKIWLSTNAIGHALAVHIGVLSQPDTGLILDLSPFDDTIFEDSVDWQEFIFNSLPRIKINTFTAIIEYGGFL